jgi:hypothetical protein
VGGSKIAGFAFFQGHRVQTGRRCCVACTLALYARSTAWPITKARLMLLPLQDQCLPLPARRRGIGVERGLGTGCGGARCDLPHPRIWGQRRSTDRRVWRDPGLVSIMHWALGNVMLEVLRGRPMIVVCEWRHTTCHRSLLCWLVAGMASRQWCHAPVTVHAALRPPDQGLGTPGTHARPTTPRHLLGTLLQGLHDPG